ncbi:MULTISPECIES: response regulator transcription factor [Acetobacter]|uniref:Response regulator transcription factor n=1 Tax=Acetobacter thailandicus TaxID=1502842 RepID=A0ABT3QEE5_9PROT|nr:MULTISPECIES: response regulator transcription factor [Acetobacter]MBS0960674.1 response regulator transcription factor [Acetobacter thailandicus]MBS0980289.1 response regulator transcription factor [Acetobacter thailandicus]MBS0986137.1 response regulator transcription factor [Acetobacter thailandicus]MBS1004038.1 response regulator transcription factor [Acetobacter thailandicus]MCX2563624.1 response regulator transcription factor [Acetobacter thailandicus]
MRILFAQDNQSLTEEIVTKLNSIGFITDVCSSGHDALEMMRNYNYGLAIIELMLPDMDGFDIINTARSTRLETPIIILSDIDKPHTKIKAFANGADDYIATPCDINELIARIQAILRRSGGFASSVTQIGDLTMDMNSQTVTVSGRPVHLTNKEFSTLKLLMMRKNITLTKEILLDNLYNGQDQPDIKIIDVFICKLRKKLADAGARKLITTIWGRGYILKTPMAISEQGAVPAYSSINAQQAIA